MSAMDDYLKDKGFTVENNSREKLYNNYFLKRVTNWVENGFSELEIGLLWEGNLVHRGEDYLIPLFQLWTDLYFEEMEGEECIHE